MSDKQLGRLQRVELREAWLSESSHFTPWLGKCENLDLLGEAIGIQLECEAQEKNVGPFRADILCKDTATDHWVLIENQLEKTDHIHLGQLLTYAAGLEAVTIVWIAERFTDEHRAALDWLNQHTDEEINFFGLEVELWRIGDSPLAPKFNVVCKPNEWTRSIAESAKQIETGELTSTQSLRLSYWQNLIEKLNAEASTICCDKATTKSCLIAQPPLKGFRCGFEISTRDPQIIFFFGSNSYKKIAVLRRIQNEFSDALEQEIGEKLNWSDDGSRKFWISAHREGDPREKHEWATQHEWLRQTGEKMLKLLPKFLTLAGHNNGEENSRE